MKLLYCEACGDIISPFGLARRGRDCRCGLHRVWWENPQTGELRVCYMSGHPKAMEVRGGAPAGSPECWILGISNSFLHHPSAGTPSAEEVKKMLDDTPDSYIFKATRSNIIRIRPGQSGDTAWALWGHWLEKEPAT